MCLGAQKNQLTETRNLIVHVFKASDKFGPLLNWMQCILISEVNFFSCCQIKFLGMMVMMMIMVMMIVVAVIVLWLNP